MMHFNIIPLPKIFQMFFIQAFLLTLVVQPIILYRLSRQKPLDFLTQYNLISVNYRAHYDFFSRSVPLCFLTYRWNKKYSNLFYRDTLQIVFDLCGIISRNEKLPMQDERSIFFILWHSNAAVLG
jgi:hypothetical protein